MCNGRRNGSNSNFSGSISIGDCRRPFVHIFHCGLINPQNAGPANWKISWKNAIYFSLNSMVTTLMEIILQKIELKL